MREAAAGKTFSFADFELDGAKRRLLKNGEFVALNPKALDLLLVLVENCGQTVTKDELLEKVWEGQFVEENNLTVHISALRKIFGEKKGEPRFILTIPGKGYTFIAEVHSDNSLFAPKQQPENSSLVETAVFAETEIDESFIGRSEEIAEIKKLLRQSDINLVTLTGAGGTGKTRLAQKIARELRMDFPASVFFVELAVVNDAESAISLIVETLSITESSGKSLLEAIKEFLQIRRTLLVLDNFEHLLSLAPLVQSFLEASSLLKILVTSRAPLRLKNEREFLVKPLELPPAEADFSLEKFAEYPAILLFCKRAQTVKPTFLLANENISPVVKICQRLDGLPLAIELAAARVTLLSPQSILDRLENSLNLLTGGAKDAPTRQRTMRETIQWSYDLLDENEQFLFRRLAIFAGGFTVEAAEAVGSSQYSVSSQNIIDNKHLNIKNGNKNLSTNHRPQTTILDILDSLIEKNLLVSKEQADGNARLRTLEVVREFAFEILQESEELAELQRIHANYFLSLAEKAEKFLLGETGNEWLEKLENEHDNLRAALNWALKNDAEIAARIAAALRFFWLNHSHLSEGLRLSRAALQLTENNYSEARSKLLLSNGLFLRNQGDLESARKFYEKSLAESRKLGDTQQIIKANHGLGAVALLQKDFVPAQKFNEEALALSRELGDKMQIAYSLCSLADFEMSRKNLSAARPLLQECLSLSKNLGNNRLLTTTYFNLGTVDFLENKYNAATSHLTESLRIAQEMGNKTMISCSLEGFAALVATQENISQAIQISGAAQTLRESINYQLEPAEEIFRDNYLNKIRSALDEKTFAELYEQGKSLDLEKTISRILNNKNIAGKESEITIENHSSRRRKIWLVAILCLIAALVVGFWLWRF